MFIAVPWDEEETGGCLAAGRGFVHISAAGDLEPCPFAPYSDANLQDSPAWSRRCAPASWPRCAGNHDRFEETEGGCALWKKRAEVEALLKENG